MADITSANAVIMLTIPLLYPVPQQLQGFAADDIFDTPDVEIAQTVMGVDGIQSAGYVPYSTKQTYSFQADSPSAIIFENWAQASKAGRTILTAFGLVSLPSIGRKYTLTSGVLTTLAPISSAKKVLQARKFTITWQDVSPAPF